MKKCEICGSSWGYALWSTIPMDKRDCPICKAILETAGTNQCAYIPEIVDKVLRSKSSK